MSICSSVEFLSLTYTSLCMAIEFLLVFHVPVKCLKYCSTGVFELGCLLSHTCFDLRNIMWQWWWFKDSFMYCMILYDDLRLFLYLNRSFYLNFGSFILTYLSFWYFFSFTLWITDYYLSVKWFWTVYTVRIAYEYG